ncbi:acyl-CoA thioesterase [Kitasatospora azatica]|uniref:acyl-CoA thioesterase n=1 Tax=Kitasatospora azatica TaxID=58347 RepID=UPI00068D25A4|nr:thioesterase family protein [Kitasatospora azatica]
MDHPAPQQAEPAEATEGRGPAAPALPSVVIERRVEWSDTDAAGHYHFSAVLRWAEAAEAVLLRRLGLGDLFGSIPRVHFEADYLERLWFGDLVRIELRVDKVGTSSLHYAFEVHGPNGPAAAGRMSVVHSAATAKGTAPWPEETRARLTESGPQRPESYTGQHV